MGRFTGYACVVAVGLAAGCRSSFEHRFSAGEAVYHLDGENSIRAEVERVIVWPGHKVGFYVNLRISTTVRSVSRSTRLPLSTKAARTLHAT